MAKIDFHSNGQLGVSIILTGEEAEALRQILAQMPHPPTLIDHLNKSKVPDPPPTPPPAPSTNGPAEAEGGGAA